MNNSIFSVSNYNYQRPIIPARSASEQSLDTLLQTSARVSDFVTLRKLVRQGACIHAENDDGMTPLKEALVGGLKFIHKDQTKMAPVGSDRDQVRKILSKCKILVDLGAIPDRDDFQMILDFLEDISAKNEVALIALATPRPNPNEPQVFIKGQFVSLADLSEEQIQAQERDIILIIFAEEYFGPNYGKITIKFHPDSNIYGSIDNKFTCVRALADSSEQLPSIYDRVCKAFPHLVIMTGIFDGHANSQLMAFGEFEHPSLSIKDTSLMREISCKLSPEANLFLTGCSCAKGERNLASLFSENSGGRPVIGSEDLVHLIQIVNCFNKQLEKPLIMALPVTDKQFKLKTYIDGKVIAGVNLPMDQSAEAESVMFNSLVSRWQFQSMTLCQKIVRVCDDYFHRGPRGTSSN